jgi:hypothetical protein
VKKYGGITTIFSRQKNVIPHLLSLNKFSYARLTRLVFNEKRSAFPSLLRGVAWLAASTIGYGPNPTQQTNT